MADHWQRRLAFLVAMLLALGWTVAAPAADFQDTQVGQWEVYRTAVRGANACQIAQNLNPNSGLPTWSFNIALYDNQKGPLIDLQGLYSGNDASLYSATLKKVAAVATIDGQQFVGDGAIEGKSITTYDSDYQGAAGAALATRLQQPIHQMTLTVGDQTITAPTLDLNTAFTLAEKCFPLWVGHPLVWQAAQTQPAPPAPTAHFFSLNQILQQGYVVQNVIYLPAADARAATNMPSVGALAMVTLQHGTRIAVCTLWLEDWIYTNPQAFAGQWCRTP